MPWSASVKELSEQLRSKRLSAVELSEEFTRRIARADSRVGAFLSTTDPERLRAAADRVDRARRQGERLSPWAGIPIAIKDNIAVEDEPLTCGSRILADYTPPYTATAVERLREAGILVIGKTNMDEFGFGSSTENSAFQTTRNPRDLERVPGGTSGGSAAAVAAGLVPWSIGTDTGGSVRQPASLCGVVGIRPSYGRVSRYGLVAYASSMDQIGPIANSVDDAAALLSLMMGADCCDSTCLSTEPPSLEKELPRLTVGIPAEYHAENCDPAILAVLETAIASIERLGWRTKEVSLPLTPQALSAYYLIASVEAASNLGRYDGVRYGHRAADRESWLDMLSSTRTEGFGDEAKRRIMLGTFASSSGYYDEYYLNALRVRTLIVNEFARAFEDVDLLLSPVSPSTAWPIGQRTEDPMSMYLSDIFSVPVSLAGIPAIVIPAGDDDAGLPVGLQIAGPALGDDLVVSAARRVEEAIGYAPGQGFALSD
jgi:aspartyl-tRNA(Asn)/glutamyl-tRNA(Gln) amidotransferase subunit A